MILSDCEVCCVISVGGDKLNTKIGNVQTRVHCVCGMHSNHSTNIAARTRTSVVTVKAARQRVIGEYRGGMPKS